MHNYKIKRSELTTEQYIFTESVTEAMKINYYPWDNNGYKPEASCMIVNCTNGFKVRLETNESKIKATYLEMNDPVYKDSCLELFLVPSLQTHDFYFNFELNSLGSLLLGYGSKFEGRKRVIMENFRDYFQIVPEVYNSNEIVTGWSVEFGIPFDFIQKHLPDFKSESGCQMKGNFYKCGDDSQYPHYGCWNRIELAEADFHVPRFFGNLTME